MSKSTFDTAHADEFKQAQYDSSFPNNKKGFKTWLKSMKKISGVPSSQWLVVFENTGSYSKLFKYWLIENQIPCVEENALLINRNAPMKRGKSDPIDAKIICEYAIEKQHKLKVSTRPNKIIEKINHLYSRRTLLVKQRKALLVSVKEKQMILHADLDALFEMQNNQLLEQYDEQIKFIEQIIEQYIALDEKMQNNYKLIKSIIGIGPITAGLLICKTENFTKITCPRKFASYVGVAPFPNSSGIRIGKNRISYKANRLLKGAISNCVQAAINHDPFFNQYALRLKAKNKPPGIIYNNIKNKLIHRVFTVVKRQSEYVKLAYQ